MANSKNQDTSMPKYLVDQTIFFLRPTNQEALAVLNATENDLYRFEVAPPTDQPLGKIIDEDSSSQESGEQMPGVAPQAQNPSNSVSSETSGVNLLNHPFAFRFGFDSVENPSREGFTFGCMPQCNVQLGSSTESRFRIHYAFKSGALLITADTPILVGGTRLSKSGSLVLMSNTIITYPGEADASFFVEFPGINHCVDLHNENYRRYSMRCGVKKFSYQRTFTQEQIIHNHRYLMPIGTGGFGTVYKAINLQNGRKVALKVTRGEPTIMKEVEIMQKLRHVRQNLLISSMY